ncbi:hypothetical protein FGE12_00060 [Aggregicoccus sp. 17bor-14]|uniref:hypothetical protein n=1 Tax=Myxococcaceae TaxID=31 RepID=UPI00129CE137|nr:MULTISPECIES: hypothetical protein [Myxococcaceae]MBF5040770.1 hypothetical protein [Simulacricoccus sp. 17bor-14]MRI86558.1 hypothetical protein [Aggregicoccus sp. 17bor-14]
MTNYAYRASVLALFLALPLAACGPGAGSSDPTAQGSSAPVSQPQLAPAACQALSGLSSEQGDLSQRLDKAVILSANTSQFREPSSSDLQAFQRAFGRLLGPVDPSAVADLEKLGFEVSRFREASSGASWLIVEEKAPRTGAGTFAINLSPARDLWLETPHADSDQGTLEQGAKQVVALGARALIITGVNRCASAAKTACDTGATAVCGGKLRTSDAAHFADNYFTAAHKALRAAYPSAVAVSLHGMETAGKEAAVVSDGTRTARPTSLSLRLRDSVNSYLKTTDGLAYSCNDVNDNGQFRPLCGSTNVQGRLDNGASDGCYTEGGAASDRFLHVEQGPILRGGAKEDPVGEGLADTIPCTMPGAGAKCPAAATPACS